MVGKAFKEAFGAGLGGSFSDGSSAAGELPPSPRPAGHGEAGDWGCKLESASSPARLFPK